MAPTLGVLGSSTQLDHDETSLSLRNNADTPKKSRKTSDKKIASQDSLQSSSKHESKSSGSKAQLLVRLLAARDIELPGAPSKLFPYVKLEVAGKMFVSAPSSFDRQQACWVWEDTQVFSFEFRLKRLEPMVRIQLFDINTGALVGAVAVDFEIFVQNGVHRSANLWVGLDRDGRGRGQGGKLHLQLVYCPSGGPAETVTKLPVSSESLTAVPAALPARAEAGREEARVEAGAVWAAASFSGAGASVVRDARSSVYSAPQGAGGMLRRAPAGAEEGSEAGLLRSARRPSLSAEAPSFVGGLVRSLLAVVGAGCLSAESTGAARKAPPRRVDSRSISIRRTSASGALDDAVSLGSNAPSAPSAPRSLRI
eukprot:tig00020780_g13791.t1